MRRLLWRLTVVPMFPFPTSLGSLPLPSHSAWNQKPPKLWCWPEVFPLIRNWRTLLICYFIWAPANFYEYLVVRNLRGKWIYASIILLPATHIIAFAFLAPLPWILSRRLRSPWNYIVGFLASAITCEVVSLLLVLPDAWLMAMAGIKFSKASVDAIYLGLVGPAMMVVGGLAAAKADTDERSKAFRSEAELAKNRLLQSQIHPHVLFNALNGLAELVHKNPKFAERAIRHLADLLRRIIRASEHMRLPLHEERAILIDYLALEAIRLEQRLRVTWHWDETLDAWEVPPLLLQPLVENSIKHGLAPCVNGGELVIRTSVLSGDLVLEVWNSGEPYCGHDKGGGVGLKNLISRLNMHFGTDATFWIGPSEGGTLASIRITARLVGIPHAQD